MNLKVYQAGLKFMLVNAVKRLYNGEVIFHHSLDHGIYATIITNKVINEKDTIMIKDCMLKIVGDNIPFNKKVVTRKEAYDFYTKKKHFEKAKNILNVSNATVSLFEFEGQYNYFYSHDMPKASGELSVFDIYYISPNEIVLLYPTDGVINFTFRHKIYEAFGDYDVWLNKQNINYVSDINREVSSGHVEALIKKNDLVIDNKLYEIAKDVIDKNKKIVAIAGPSSSGKTTTSKKLSLYIASLGKKAIPVSLDDFFLNRGETPKDENGNYDYECLNALDLNLFNEDLQKLLNGEEVVLPRFDFIDGVKLFDNAPIRLDEDEILVIEGLHAINPELLSIDSNVLYKIYISPLTPLNVDRHNYISTTDNRLLRRIVRDFRTRGRSAETSLESWASVRNGEEKYIFPYTDNCDAIVNTAYIYEIGVLKVYVEPLLYDIDIDSPMFNEARRLLDSLKTFYPIPSEYVAKDNLLREFIGGSSFEE